VNINYLQAFFGLQASTSFDVNSSA